MNKSILLSLFISFCSVALANNMLVQNVTTTGNNAVNKTIQVQFDISWDNSWRDEINWDAAWIFMKFKDANGLWQHCQLNQTGFTNGSGTANTVQVTSDKVGSWLYRSAQGAGTFNTTGMQLQWNYGLSGLTDVAGLEVRVFAVEMVYVPEGEFNCAKKYSLQLGSYSCLAPGSNFAIVNQRLSPQISLFDGSSLSLRIKGNTGIDTNNDGIIDNTSYPTGYQPFFCYKYQLSEQQYADFLNTLTPSQIVNLGIAGRFIYQADGQYFSSQPNLACYNGNSTFGYCSGALSNYDVIRFYSYGDWSGLRPMSFWECNKAIYGPIQPVKSQYNDVHTIGDIYTAGLEYIDPFNVVAPNWGGTQNSTRGTSGASYYGIMQMTTPNIATFIDCVQQNTIEPVVKPSSLSFTTENGDGLVNSSGFSDIAIWHNAAIIYLEQSNNTPVAGSFGFRYVRSAE